MRFTLPYNLYRFMGITGLFLVLYIVVFGVFGNVDVSGLLPIKLATEIQEAWPQMPFFTVQKEPVNGGHGQEIYYTVPTRQITPQELAQMEKGKPAAKSTATAPATSAPVAR